MSHSKERYVCEACKVEYKKCWSDEEALREAKDTFPEFDMEALEEWAIVCDHCYKKIMQEEQ